MRTMDPGYPKPITIWKGIPDSPQGAFVDKANGSLTVKHIDTNQKTQSNTLKYCRPVGKTCFCFVCSDIIFITRCKNMTEVKT